MGHFFERFVVGLANVRDMILKLPNIIERDEMDMSMGDLFADDLYTYTLRFEDFPNAVGDLLGRGHHCLIVLVRQIPEVIYLFLWYHKGMPRLIRIDIQEGQGLFILVNFIGRNFSFDDLGEDTVSHLTYQLRRDVVKDDKDENGSYTGCPNRLLGVIAGIALELGINPGRSTSGKHKTDHEGAHIFMIPNLC